MDNLYCVGGEKNLTECRFDGWGVSDCEESEAAGVVCIPGPVSRYSPAVQLSPTTKKPSLSTTSQATTTTTTAAPTQIPKMTTERSTTEMAIKTTSVDSTVAYQSTSTPTSPPPINKRLQQDMAPSTRIKVYLPYM